MNQNEPTPAIPQETFANLGVAPNILSALTNAGFLVPTPIQHKAIPVAISGKDVVGIAQTGTGKSLAFGIPVIQRLMQAGKGKALIILPTRELAIQIEETFLKFGRAFGLRTAVIIGGAPMYAQINAIRKSPHIIIGTPGRINDHIKQRTLNLSDTSILVLDEADAMLDMGFAPQIKQILLSVPKERQTLLFSATMPDEIINIATSYMKLPVRVEIAKPGTTAEKVEHEIFFVKKEERMNLLKKLLQEYKGSVLVFARTKHGVKKITENLFRMSFTSAEIHSNRSLSQRRQALDGFKSGRFRVLVATDIASRGIDVKGIELVVNYDIPESPGDYVHRIGRTGRAGMPGRAISFVMSDQKGKLREIERLIKTTIKVSRMEGIADATPVSNSTSMHGQSAPASRYNNNNNAKRGHAYPPRSQSKPPYQKRYRG